MNDSDVAGVGQSRDCRKVEVSCRGVHRHTLRKVKAFIEKNVDISQQFTGIYETLILYYMYISKMITYSKAQLYFKVR